KNPRMNKAITDAIVILEETLKSFGVKAKVTQVVAGPAVTRYEVQPAPGVKVSRITSLSDDIALTLAASDVRIEAPIPGKSVVGIEVPRGEIATVYFREVIETENFMTATSKIAFALGKNIGGEAMVGDMGKMPHLLIAGATGSGKSICINSIICSFLYKARPDQVKLMLIDPKKVELALYNGIPHLLTPVVTDNKKAAGCLKWAVKEMEDRYSLFAANAVKDFHGYNKIHPDNLLPQIVIIIDELADLMMVAPADVEESICRLAQMARAAGIHLIVATQRPSVDVITGLIKANIPSRIAFAVSSGTDSRTILDMTGAEKLLGKGDMLYHPVGMPKPVRVHFTFIEEKDIQKIVYYCCQQAKPNYFDDSVIVQAAASCGKGKNNSGSADNDS
ncbi:MAG: DNA translocase FtsK, partial [Clostridiales bacterium]